MRAIIPSSLSILAQNLPVPLYAVGGVVRDFLADLTPSNRRDWDICAPLSAETFVPIATACRFTVRSVFKNTGTVKLEDENGQEYEYSCFRSDEYVRGTHRPTNVYFTNDILLDAVRRDFTANAVYYDIRKGEYVDPLQGIPAIREKRLTTVASAEKVFGEDGLRLMRLARQVATLGFQPDSACLAGARANARLIQDVSPERIFTELRTILRADQKYGVMHGQYYGLKVLDDTRVLDYVLPALTAGRGMTQRADFHNHDVLEHSLKAVYYANADVRLTALLHDLGKPYCTLQYGNSHEHPSEGARLARETLTALKAPKKEIEETALLIELHMYDLDGKTSENKLRRFLVKHADVLEKLLLVKQADFSACKDDVSPAPTCVRWKTLLEKMREECVPFSRKDLAVTAQDLLGAGIPAPNLSNVFQRLLLHTAVLPKDNQKALLVKLAKGYRS